jgi:serine phosphatase RsbU (regulator of sigma subunit)
MLKDKLPTPEERLNILKTTALFANVPDETLMSLQDKMEAIRLPAGTILFREGEPGDGLYLVVEGRLEIISDDVLIATRGPGEYVGELALVDDAQRSATCRAEGDVTLLKLHRADFQQILKTSSEAANAMLRLLVRKIREDTEQRVGILLREKQLQYDLKRAHEIQTAMLPSEDLRLDWVHLTGKSRPAADVGGDYYDYFLLPTGDVSVAIGDVAGHGFYSGLLVAIVGATLQLQVEIDYSLPAVISSLNKAVRNYRHTRMLMTFSYLLISPSSRTFTVVNAGHPAPYLYRHKTQQWTALVMDSLPLGVNLPISPKRLEIHWQRGDRLFLYTDGLIEARNNKDEPYGFDALESFLDRCASLAPCDMVNALYKEMDNYRGGGPLEDDLTVVVVEFL